MFFNYSFVISYRNIEKIARLLSPLMNPLFANKQGLSFYKGKHFSSAFPLKMQRLQGMVLCDIIREKGFSLLPHIARMGGKIADLINWAISLPCISGSINLFIQHPLVFAVCLECTRSCYSLAM